MRVLEIGDEMGEFCGLILAGQGAEVIKIEPPGGGRTRRIGPFYQDVQEPDRSLFFWMYNRGKRGVTVDLTRPEGKRAFMELVMSAEVLLDAQGLGVMDALGLGYDALRAHKPDLIYCSITPFGLTGPWKGFKGSDMVHLALGGSTYCCGYDPVELGKWDTPPMTPQSWHAYCVAGEHAAMAIAAALLVCQTTGLGQLVDVSVHDACAQCTEGTVPRYIYYKHDSFRRVPNQVRCSDGNYVVILFQPPADVPKLGRMIAQAGIHNDLLDPKYAAGQYIPSFEVREYITRVIAEWAATRPAMEVFHGLQSCDIPCAPVRPPEEMIDDPQCIFNEDFVEVEHPELGKRILYPRHPRRQREMPWRWGPRAPLVGEHNEDVLGRRNFPTKPLRH